MKIISFVLTAIFLLSFVFLPGQTVSADGDKSAVKLEVNVVKPPGGGGGGGGGHGPSDKNPPRIYGSLLCGIDETTADICWTTNEYSTSQVFYWSSPGSFSPLDKKYVTRHRVQLTDLTPGTTYSYIEMSEDRAGNLRRSETLTFTTLGKAPVEPKPAPPEPEKPEPLAPAPPTQPTPPTPPPPAPPEEQIPWSLVGGIIAAVVIAVLAIYFWMRRRRSA